ncbi:MAG: GAF domain-containing protein [Phycisphaerales bacterium]|nr:MAG: GAF domain-containing protein [Phycisphaerales bacterium]
MRRPYEELRASLTDLSADRQARMQAVVDALWDALHVTGVSWVGFYLHKGEHELVLGPRRDGPACSPISIQGACGQALIGKQALVVRDVAELGENYIACDPRDRSEVVLPLFEESGACWGVLDLDSHEIGAFDDSDVAGLQSILITAGLTRATSQVAG